MPDVWSQRMKSYLFVGDTHGDLTFAFDAIAHARTLNAEIIQLGDWGYYWPGSVRKVQVLSDALVAHDVTMRFIDGNHDAHPRLRGHVSTCIATTIAPRLIYQPRGSVHEDEDGTRFLFLGGAPSIDRASRIEGQSWWPEEVIAVEEFERARNTAGPIHVLVTHDAPRFPPGFSAKGSPDYRQAQQLSMKQIDAIIRHHRPALHIHGHWHRHYERQHQTGTHVVGLDCNFALFEDAVLQWSRAEAST
jgi:hypothetical protein